MRLPWYSTTAAPPAALKGEPFPYHGASFFSKITMQWINPIMKIAWSRPMTPDDFWDPTPDLESKNLGDSLEANYMKRVPPSERPYPYRPSDQALSPFPPQQQLEKPINGTGRSPQRKGYLNGLVSKLGGRGDTNGGRTYDRSLFKAFWATYQKQYWLCVALELTGQALRMVSPLVTRRLIAEISRAYAYYQAIHNGLSTDGLQPPRSVGYMLGMAFLLWGLLVASSWVLYLAAFHMTLNGKKVRSSLITMISRKAMRLSGKSRVKMTNGKLTTMVSVDCSSIDAAAIWTVDPIAATSTLCLMIGLLINNIGYSALAGIATVLLTVPLQTFMFKRIAKLREAQTEIIDSRVRLLSEILNNIRAVKLYAYEEIWSRKMSKLRSDELHQLRKNSLSKSGLTMVMSFISTLAAIVTFITYALSGHSLDSAIVFSTLQLFGMLSLPVTFIPQALMMLSEARVACGRLSELFSAEELQDDIKIDSNSPYAIQAHASFQFESSAPPEVLELKDKKDESDVEEKPDTSESDDKPFQLKGVNLQIPHGALVCVVGAVGTGKTALLSGLIHEMKRTEGEVVFGGPISYVPQHAWVQSGSIKDNITFAGTDSDINRVNEIIDACALTRDVKMWPDGIQTKVGERGITMSGGQRQRICIARAAYSRSSIVLLDDPLSAVDAHVGHHLLEQCILQGPLSYRTRVLVTHHLDVLPKADLVLVMERDDNGDGRIVQQGSYQDLMSHPGVFQTLINDHGSLKPLADSTKKTDAEDESHRGIQSDDAASKSLTSSLSAKEGKDATDEDKEAQKLIIDEEKAEGSVSWAVYLDYARSIKSWILPVLVVTLLISSQAAKVGNNLFLGYWSEDEFKDLTQGAYMGIYGALGGLMAALAFFAIYTTYLCGIGASYNLFGLAWQGVIRSPTSWHDRTPTGRIINRLSKDIESLDDRLPQVWYGFTNGLLGILGSLALVLYTYPWVGLMFIPVFAYVFIGFVYYRTTTRDVQRLSSIIRSHMYTNFGEQLSGMPVIRAFHRQNVYKAKLEESIDNELVSVLSGNFTQGKWIGLRISLSGNLLILAVAIFGVIFRNTVPPSRFGVVLTYLVSTISMLADFIRMLTELEQLMNNAERVQYYAALPREAPPTLPSDPAPDDTWPQHGAVSFKDVQLQYRPDLPLVLKGLSFNIHAGEKVGVIGRTGAGKSSVAQALFRTVEICGGVIDIDGVDLTTLGLDTLRHRISIIPQDTFLFSGSVRDNIDPTSSRSDAELNDVLHLIRSDSDVLKAKFQLDAVVANEGSNFSAGERQILALVRALVKRCKVLLLDEATSSVDPKTDALIQKIIRTQLRDVTLISIAHRLQTVAYYDRILTLDEGQVVEFASPEELFDNPQSVFRALCDTKGFTKEDLLRIREGAEV
ncbi:hypothetical protein IAT38_001598 [Cryptococcus sp. DSM 104549]